MALLTCLHDLRHIRHKPGALYPVFSIAERSFNQISSLWIGMENPRLVIVQIGNAKREPAFQSVLEFVPITGLEVHEKERALRAENVVYVIPVIRVIKGITGVTA